jgi:hypothetical protein
MVVPAPSQNGNDRAATKPPSIEVAPVPAQPSNGDGTHN